RQRRAGGMALVGRRPGRGLRGKSDAAGSEDRPTLSLDPPGAPTSLVSDKLYPSRAGAQYSPDPPAGKGRGFTVVEIEIAKGAKLPTPGTYYGKVPVKGGTWWACLIANALGATSFWKGDIIMPRNGPPQPPVDRKPENRDAPPDSILDKMKRLVT